jgi:hypothetical protein
MKSSIRRHGRLAAALLAVGTLAIGGFWSVTASSGAAGAATRSTGRTATSCNAFLPSGSVIGMASTFDDGGYWVASNFGEVVSCGDAINYGSLPSSPNRPIVGIATTPDGGGFWLVASDGGIFTFGDALFFGSTGALRLNQPVVGMASTPDGLGYWLVAADGGIFSFGDAQFFGSTGSLHLNQPIVVWLRPRPEAATGSLLRMVGSLPSTFPSSARWGPSGSINPSSGCLSTW